MHMKTFKLFTLLTSLDAFFHIYFPFETYLFSMVHMEQIGYTVSHCDKSFL